MAELTRRLPVGAEVQEAGGTHFRVWAPRRGRVEVVFDGQAAALTAEGNGYFSGVVAAARNGTRYRYRLDGGDAFPDPASRFQPDGPHGASQVVDPSRFRWSDAGWPGISDPQVIYEMHLGTFTPQGTWVAAQERLPDLAELGVTTLEVMPVADFPGTFGWGYDCVNLFAPSRLYGAPDDMRRFVDAAHAAGLAVLLDVVYNHLGPDGNYLRQYADGYVTDRYKNEWGEALNFDGPGSGPVREFFAANAAYWIDEFHLDGLRLDATQQIFDASEEHILVAVGRAARQAGSGRRVYLVAENEEQHAELVRDLGLDALWNDDFHHSALVAVTGKNPAYYTDYLGAPQEFISAAKWGYLYQGQHYAWQKKRRGRPALDLSPLNYITCVENHDQVANSATGRRLHQLTSPGRLRAVTALLLLSPATPMLFQGQEFASSKPFLYFADHNPDLAKLVAKGRGEFLTQFPDVALPESQERIADPGDRRTFERCVLDWSERGRNTEAYALHRDLIRLRKTDPVFRAPRPRGVDGAVLGPQAFVLRYFGDGEDRLLVVNFGGDLPLAVAPEPLLAPPEGKAWSILWASDAHAYGGTGTPPLEVDGRWRIPGEAAVVLTPLPSREGGNTA